jgi:hypothetical protein
MILFMMMMILILMTLTDPVSCLAIRAFAPGDVILQDDLSVAGPDLENRYSYSQSIQGVVRALFTMVRARARGGVGGVVSIAQMCFPQRVTWWRIQKLCTNSGEEW